MFASLVLLFISYVHSQSNEAAAGANNKSPPCGLLHSNELYNNPNLTLVNEFPWVVALKYTYAGGDNRTNYGEYDNEGVDGTAAGAFLCTGSLINERYVLTSASCVDKERQNMEIDFVRVGKYNIGFECVKNLLSDDCSPSMVDVRVNRTLIHPSYNTTSLENNIALLELAENVTFTEYLRPICLQTDSTASKADGNKEYWTSGFLLEDNTKIIKANNRMVISDQECSANLNQTVNTFCTKESTKGLCISDAGGPLVYPDGEQWYQEGISSHGTKCGPKEAVTVYTRLDEYRGWIMETAAT